MKKTMRVILFATTMLLIFVAPAQNHSNQQLSQNKDNFRTIPCPEIIYPMTADLRPVIRKRESAYYTVQARDNKIQGTVILQAIFHESGKITDIRTIRGLPYGLTEQAIGTAYNILFTPAMKDGKPVSIRGSLEFTFKLY